MRTTKYGVVDITYGLHTTTLVLIASKRVALRVAAVSCGELVNITNVQECNSSIVVTMTLNNVNFLNEGSIIYYINNNFNVEYYINLTHVRASIELLKILG